MRSRHVDRFNHDEDAPDYDRDVRDESDPIRAGYGELLAWVAASAEVDEHSRVLELGSGTGNLTCLLPAAERIVCVDVSSAMSELARQKLGDRPEVEWLESDLLEVFDRELGRFDRIVSTYAVHHLTTEEKSSLFREIRRVLAPGGRAVFGDLAFESTAAAQRTIADWREKGEAELIETVEDEFFWDLAWAREELEGLGFRVATRRFSDLSWGIGASA